MNEGHHEVDHRSQGGKKLKAGERNNKKEVDCMVKTTRYIFKSDARKRAADLRKQGLMPSIGSLKTPPGQPNWAVYPGRKRR
jgi:hypothetical protein